MTSENILNLHQSKFLTTTILVLLIALTSFLSIDIFSPSLPAIADRFFVAPGIAQLTIALYLCGFGISQLFYGPFSDYYGRRPTLLIGFTIFVIGSCFCIVASSILILLIGRIIQGLGLGAGAALSRVILRDLFINNKMSQATSYLSGVIAITTAVAPGIGGFMQQYFGYQGNLWLMFLSSILVLILLFCFLPETNKNLIQAPLKIRNVAKNYVDVFRNKIFACNAICSGMALSGLIAYATINPFLLQNTFGIMPAIYGLLTIVIASGELIGNLVNAVLVNQYGMKKMLLLGFSIISIAGAGLISIHNITTVSLIFIIFLNFLANLGIAFILPNTAAQAFSAFHDRIGFVGALYGFQQILVTAFTIYMVANLQLQSQIGLGYVLLILGILSFCSYQVILNQHKQELCSPRKKYLGG